jgi:hypothetical protein
MIRTSRGGDSRSAGSCLHSIPSTSPALHWQELAGLSSFQENVMSAHHVYDNAPLGSLIRYSDGTTKPPARFNKKLAAWQNRNGVGRLVKKDPQRDRPTYTSPASITLHEGDFGSGGVVLVKVMRTHSVDSDLRFEIIERPAIGAVRILQEHADAIELLHLAVNRDAAERWLTQHRYSDVRLEEVTADEVGADVVEGRAA